MTRETKIGLLVGLAFIIVIGILLSEQIVQSTEPPPAPRAEVADTLRKGTATPVSQHKRLAPAVAAQDTAPDAPVPTREDVNRRPPVTFVNVGPGRAHPNDAMYIGGSNTPRRETQAAGQGNDASSEADSSPPDRAANPNDGQATPGGRRSIAEEAARVGETLVGPDGRPLRATTPLTPPAGPAVSRTNGNNASGHEAHAAAAMTQYKAEAGDSLSRLAQKLMGSNSKANRDAIIKANPSLAADPNKIIIGVTYHIPTSAAAIRSTPENPPAPAPTPRTPERAAASAAENIYVVQPGDNLSRIAKERMGNLSAMAAIKELNKDVVKNWDVLPVGTKLKLPGKPIASAQ